MYLHNLDLGSWLHKIYKELNTVEILSVSIFVFILNWNIEMVFCIVFPVLQILCRCSSQKTLPTIFWDYYGIFILEKIGIFIFEIIV